MEDFYETTPFLVRVPIVGKTIEDGLRNENSDFELNLTSVERIYNCGKENFKLVSDLKN